MKKTLVSIAAFCILGAAVFAQNAPYGLDIAWGFGAGMKTSNWLMADGSTQDTRYVEMTAPLLLPTKFSTYDCFGVGNHVGIYASVGFLPTLGFGIDSKDIYAGIGLEFMAGPAFGVDIGWVRFQTGVAFHGLVGLGWSMGDSGANTVRQTALGVALTPQFRFDAYNPVSFILGCDFAVDMAYNESRQGRAMSIGGVGVLRSATDKGFRFSATPYIGVGINFFGRRYF